MVDLDDTSVEALANACASASTEWDRSDEGATGPHPTKVALLAAAARLRVQDAELRRLRDEVDNWRTLAERTADARQSDANGAVRACVTYIRDAAREHRATADDCRSAAAGGGNRLAADVLDGWANSMEVQVPLALAPEPCR